MNALTYIVHLVLTGGPCAGKTTALNYIREKLLDQGIYPIILPEISTLLIQSGISPVDDTLPIPFFESLIIDQTLFFERMTTEAIKRMPHKKIVVIHDRGLMDIKAYMDEESFTHLLNRYGLSLPQMRDERYKAVFHLRTAALGAEAFYTCANNTARTETLAEARAIDERTLNAWNGHKRIFILDNSTDFQEKLHRLYCDVCGVLGIPSPLNIERKFLVTPIEAGLFDESGVQATEIEIEQFYITPHPDDGPNIEVRLRKRTQYGESIYWETRKVRLSNGKYNETEHQVTAREYQAGKKYKIPGTIVIQKKRHCFVYKNRYFELDVFPEQIQHGIHVLEVRPTDEAEEIILPPFLDIVREVTGDLEFSNPYLAKA